MAIGFEQKIDRGMKVDSDGSLQITQRFVTYGEGGLDFDVILGLDNWNRG